MKDNGIREKMEVKQNLDYFIQLQMILDNLVQKLLQFNVKKLVLMLSLKVQIGQKWKKDNLQMPV